MNNPYNESNFKIQPLENGCVVRSDSERFGNNEIVFQGISYDECLNYISERVDNYKPSYYVIKDLASWRGDVRELYGLERSSNIERFDSVDDAIDKFNEYKAMDYLKQEVLDPQTNKPMRRLALGVSYNPNYSAEMDLLHTESNKTLLISDIVGEREFGYERFMTNDKFIRDLNVITENVAIDEYSYYRDLTIEELAQDRLNAWKETEPDYPYTMEHATQWAERFVQKRPYYLRSNKVNERVPFAEFHPPYLATSVVKNKNRNR